VLGYKVHSKVLLITRKTGKNIQYITQAGTGNYNERTARQYTDLSLVTSNPEIGMDAVAFFNDILVGNIAGSYKHLLVAPSTMRNTIMELIETEIEQAKAGKPCSILAKFNSLTDKAIIDKLIEASQAGVEIKLIIRGICCLRPGIPGKTDLITIISVVGRFLEHSRVYCFGTGERRRVYISSADWMTRNTERRFEVACPVMDTLLAERIVNMLETHLHDNVKARVLQADGSYSRIRSETGSKLDSQTYLFQEAYNNTAYKPNADPIPQIKRANLFQRIMGKTQV
jgi:polyphosphate kinase